MWRRCFEWLVGILVLVTCAVSARFLLWPRVQNPLPVGNTPVMSPPDVERRRGEFSFSSDVLQVVRNQPELIVGHRYWIVPSLENRERCILGVFVLKWMGSYRLSFVPTGRLPKLSSLEVFALGHSLRLRFEVHTSASLSGNSPHPCEEWVGVSPVAKSGLP